MPNVFDQLAQERKSSPPASGNVFDQLASERSSKKQDQGSPKETVSAGGVGRAFLKQGVGMLKEGASQLDSLGNIAFLGMPHLLEPKDVKARREQLLTPQGVEERTGSKLLQAGEVALPVGEAVVGSALARSIKPVASLAAGFGAGFAVDKAAAALGAPPWLSAEIGTAAGALVGARVGMSPESIEAFKAGPTGFLRRLIKGPTTADKAADLFITVRGRAPRGVEKIQAVNYLDEFKRIHKEGGDEASAQFIEELKAGPWKGRPPKVVKSKLTPKTTTSATTPVPTVTTSPAKSAPSTEEPLNARFGKRTPKPEGSNYARYVDEKNAPTSKSSRELRPGKVHNVQAQAKNLTMATRFKNLGMSRKTIERMTEAEYNQHRIAENAIRKQQGLPQMDPPRPGPARRSFAETKADILNTFDEL